MLQLKRKGVSAEIALSEFCRELSSVDWIVAHNIEFDRQVTRAACYRLGLADPFERIGHGLREFCTMQVGRALCGIWASRRNGSRYIKYPTLHELHLELFESGADNLHDALADVLVCLRCYLKMQHEHDMMTCNRARQLYSLYGIGSTQKEK
jgi:DNA polymerase III epsilon subunit-like protein